MGVLDVVKAPFKAIGKGFKWIGKQIMKGFTKLGKFMNKFGILGQIGMMFITGGISSAMFAGLRTLGQGFMAGLANSSSAIAQAAHKVLSGAVKLAKIPGNTVGTAVKETFGTISEAVTTTVKDTFNYIGKAMPGGTPIAAPDIGGSITKIGNQLIEQGGQIIPKTKAAWTQSVGDASKFFKEVDFTKMAYSPETKPIFAKFQQTNPETGELLFDKEGNKLMTTKEIAYDSKNREAWGRAAKADMDKFIMETSDPTKSGFMDYPELEIQKGIDVPKIKSEKIMTPEFGESIMAGHGKEFVGPQRLPYSQMTGAEHMASAQDVSKAYKAAEAATDYDPTKQFRSEFIQKTIDDRAKTGILQKAGAEFGKEARDWFTLQKFGSAGTSTISQSLIPKRDLSPMGYGPSRQQAVADTDRNNQLIAAIVGNQIDNQVAWDSGNMDSFYGGEGERMFAGSDTYARFMDPSLKGNFETSYA